MSPLRQFPRRRAVFLCFAAFFSLAPQLPVLAEDGAEVNPLAGAMVSLDVTIAEITPPSRGDGEDVSAKEEEAMPLFDAAGDARAQLGELHQQGRVRSLTRFQLATLDQQKAMVQVGEQAPVVTGRSRVAARGGASPFGGDAAFANSYSMQNFGSMVQAAPRVEEGGAVLVELRVEKSCQASPAPPKTTDGPEGFMPPGTVTVTLNTTVRVPANETVIVSGAQSSGGDGSQQLVVLSSASVTPAPAAASADSPRESEEAAVVKMFQLQNASAEDSVKLLQRLVDRVSLAADVRTNTLIAKGRGADLEMLEAVLVRLDEARQKR